MFISNLFMDPWGKYYYTVNFNTVNTLQDTHILNIK